MRSKRCLARTSYAGLSVILAAGMALTAGCGDVETESPINRPKPAAETAPEPTETSAVEEALLEVDVRSTLLSELEGDSLNIDVDVEDGRVLLSGDVAQRETAELAGEVAATVEGVQSVENELVVEETGEGAMEEVGREVDDAILGTKVKTALLGELDVEALGIDVDTSGGKVFLSGDVNNEAQRDLAIQTAEQVEGVTEVQSELEVAGS